MNRIVLFIVILAIIGFIDASYITYEHYNNQIPPCSINSTFIDCGKVLKSSYSTLFGIPIAVFGMAYYGFVIALAVIIAKKATRVLKSGLLYLSTAGFLMCIYFVFLQLFVIQAICIYCMISALIGTCIFVLSFYLLKTDTTTAVYAKK